MAQSSNFTSRSPILLAGAVQVRRVREASGGARAAAEPGAAGHPPRQRLHHTGAAKGYGGALKTLNMVHKGQDMGWTTGRD